jgi:hypothetical protein
MATEVETWEGEGGATPALSDAAATPISGTPSQVEWAERIKPLVNAEFDRVAAAFRSTLDKQCSDKRSDTEAIIAILEGKRAEVMNRTQAGYFITEWQEISDQVRQLIFHDARYQTIKNDRAAR